MPKQLPDGRNVLYAWFSAMHTRVDIVLLGYNEVAVLQGVAESIEAEVARIEKFANRFDAASELSTVNQFAYEQALPISAELSEILLECEKLRQNTLGYFDIAVGAGLALDAPRYTLEKQEIKLAQPNVKLDLSGYIKGYALRCVKRILDAAGIADALINIGNSSIMALGNHPFGKGWAVQAAQTAQTYTLCDECLTTSGNHTETPWPIINPKSGKVAEQGKAVSVITTDGAVGEAMAKALFLANEEEKSLILAPQPPQDLPPNPLKGEKDSHVINEK